MGSASYSKVASYVVIGYRRSYLAGYFISGGAVGIRPYGSTTCAKYGVGDGIVAILRVLGVYCVYSVLGRICLAALRDRYFYKIVSRRRRVSLVM